MKNKERIKKIILIISIIIFVLSLGGLIYRFWPRKVDVILPPKNNDSGKTESGEEIVLADNPINFAEQWAQNPEICAWISVPGANVSYPVLQSSETAENYYLDHDVEGKSSAYGAIYIQRNNNKDFSDANTVVYGHNMKNRTMFGSLRNFRKKEFFDENRYIYIYTPGHILTYEIYSAFIYDNRHILNSFDFTTKEGFNEFIAQTISPKTMTKNVLEDIEITDEDKIITLSTCTGVDTQRYLVVGVLIDDTPTK